MFFNQRSMHYIRGIQDRILEVFQNRLRYATITAICLICGGFIYQKEAAGTGRFSSSVEKQPALFNNFFSENLHPISSDVILYDKTGQSFFGYRDSYFEIDRLLARNEDDKDICFIEEDQEYAVKAAFLYRFTQYIQWGPLKDTPTFNIAVIGESKLTSFLSDLAKSKTVGSKKLVVTQYSDVSQIPLPCHVVFKSYKSSVLLKSITGAYHDKPTLIVTEESGFMERGAHINFVVNEDKIKFEVNLIALRACGLDASSQLLKLATFVKQ